MQIAYANIFFRIIICLQTIGNIVFCCKNVHLSFHLDEEGVCVKIELFEKYFLESIFTISLKGHHVWECIECLGNIELQMRFFSYITRLLTFIFFVVRASFKTSFDVLISFFYSEAHHASLPD